MSVKLFDQGVTLVKQGNYQEAVHILTDYLDGHPNKTEAWNEKGFALEQLKYFDHALICYEKALEIKPDFVAAWVNLGNLLARRNLIEEALRAYNRALKIDPNSMYALMNKFQVLYKMHRYDEALTVLDIAIKHDPENPKLWFYRGFILSTKAPTEFADHDEALESFTKGLEYNPKRAKLWYYKSIFYAGLGDKKNALENLAKAIELDLNFKSEAQTEEAYERYHKEPEYQTIVGLVPALTT